MRASIVTATLVCLFAVGSAIAQAHYSTSETDIGTLLDDPAAVAIVNKYIPGFSTKDQIDMARSLTLKGLQQYAPDTYTDKVLAEIDADLAKLPAKK
jgi:hypothetical protein